MVVDRTPPSIVDMHREGYPRAYGQIARLVGSFASSDTLKLRLWAGDNHRLTHVVYALGAPANLRDSLAVAGWASLSDLILIPLRDE